MATQKLDPIKRKKIEDLVLGVVKILDTSKLTNYKRYEALLRTMTNEEFEAWANTMGHEVDDTIQLFQLPFEEMKVSQMKEAAEFLATFLPIPGQPKFELEEYIYFRHVDPRGVRSKMKVPVGYVHIKRLQQVLSKKNRYALDNEETDMKSGQVRGGSKVASVSEPEVFALSAINANSALKELLGPRADNYAKKDEMYRRIARDGFVSLEELPEDIEKSTTINTLNTYLLSAGIRSDLVNNSLKTLFTINNENKKK